MSMRMFLHYYDGEYRVGEFEKLELLRGAVYYNGIRCNIGDTFVVPVKFPNEKGRYSSVRTVLGYDFGTHTWHFKGFENYRAEDLLCRKV